MSLIIYLSIVAILVFVTSCAVCYLIGMKSGMDFINGLKSKGCSCCTTPDGKPVKHLILSETCGEANFCPVCGRNIQIKRQNFK